MASLNSEEKTIITIVSVVILILGCVFVYNIVLGEKESNELVGDWYCVSSERYNFNGEYEKTSYKVGDYCAMSIKGMDNGLFYGTYYGSPVTGYMVDKNMFEFRTQASGEYNIQFVAKISEEDRNIIHAGETRYVEGTDLSSTGYYILAKDISKVPIVNVTNDKIGSKEIIEEWDIQKNNSSYILYDGEHEFVGDWSVDVIEKKGQLFKAIVNYTDDEGVPGTAIMLCSMICTVDGWAAGISIDDSLASFRVYMSDDVMFMCTVTQASVFEKINATRLCFVKDGAVEPIIEASFDLTGRTYSVVSSYQMDNHGNVTEEESESFKIEFVSENKILVYGSMPSNPGIEMTGYCIIDSKGDIKQMGMMAALFDAGTIKKYVNGMGVLSSDYDEIVITVASLTENGDWVSKKTVLEYAGVSS